MHSRWTSQDTNTAWAALFILVMVFIVLVLTGLV